MDTRIEEDVVLAVLRALSANGYRHITLEGIARTVKRARTSLYRRWPSKRHLVAFAVVSTLKAEPAPDCGSLRQDLICAVETLRRAFAGPLGQALPGLLADMAHDRELDRIIRSEVLARRRASIEKAILRGVARGEICSGLRTDVIIDLLTAPCYFRVLFGHARTTRAFVETVVDYVLRAAARNRVSSVDGIQAGPRVAADEFSSPACLMHEVSDVYMGYADKAELVAFLDELLELARAGAWVALESARAAGAGRLRDLLRTVEQDEARWCSMLLLHIRALGGEPSSKAGDIYDKAMAMPDVRERMVYLNGRQGCIVKKLRKMLPRVRDSALHGDLADMLRSRESNSDFANGLGTRI